MENSKKIDYTKYMTLLALVVLFIISAFMSKHFTKWGNLMNILRQVSYTGIIALGMTFVIISRGIDLSVGSLTALTGGLAVFAFNAGGGTWGALGLAVLVALVIGTAGGAINGIIVTKFKIAPFIATLGTMTIFRSIALYIVDAGEYRSTGEIYKIIGSGKLRSIPGVSDIPILGKYIGLISYPVIIFLLLAFILSILLNNTKFGRYVCAVGSNQQVARYAAIKVNMIKFLTYCITGFTVGITALMLSSRLNSISSSNAGLSYELDAIAAVVIGGTSMAGGKGTIWGTVMGAIILGIINNMLNMVGVSPYLQGAVKGGVIILAVLLQYKSNDE